MSKAFVNEDLEVPEELALPERPSEPLPITARGEAALRTRLAHLTESCAPARDSAAPERSREQRVLARVLETVIVRAPALQNGGVGFGCMVEVTAEHDAPRARHARTYEIVGPDEAAPSEGRVSVTSPLARALLGHRAGDVVVVDKPSGEVELTIVAVRVPS